MLKLGNAKPELARWARKNFSCNECETNKQPKARRPAVVPRSYRFNHVIGLDLTEVKNMHGVKEYWMNIICWGAAYQ